MFINHYSEDRVITRHGERICPNCMRAMTNEHPDFFGSWVCVYCEGLGATPQRQEITKPAPIKKVKQLKPITPKPPKPEPLPIIPENENTTNGAVRSMAMWQARYSKLNQTCESVLAKLVANEIEDAIWTLAKGIEDSKAIKPTNLSSRNRISYVESLTESADDTPKETALKKRLEAQDSHAKRMSTERRFYRSGLYELHQAIKAGKTDPNFLLQLLEIRLEAKFEEIAESETEQP